MTSSEGSSQFRSRRRLALGILVPVVFSALVFVRATAPGHETLHWLVAKAGGVLILAAIAGRCWCALYIGGRKNAGIVRRGPYSVTRNPLYLFSTIGAAGVGALSGSIVVAAALATMALLVLRAEIQAEEAELSRQHGEPYDRYRRDVPRLFPDPRRYRESGILLVRPLHIYRTFADGLVFLAAYPFFWIVEYLQGNAVLPVLIDLY